MNNSVSLYIRISAMLFAAVVALACAGAVSASTVPPHPEKVYYDLENSEKLFQDFIVQHKKHYLSENERLARFEIFKQTLKELNELNSAWPNTVFGVNKFSDLTPNEKKKFFGHKPMNGSEIVRIDPYLPAGIIDLPDSFDWRDKNVVSPVKDQKLCSTCYIFAAIGNIEGQYAMKHSQCVAFSEQQVLDCMPDTSCEQGGIEVDVMKYLAQSGYPCERESDYPYQSQKGTCTADKSKGVAVVQGGDAINMPDEDTLAQTLVQTGPLSIGMDGKSLLQYHGGVMPASKCGGQINHAVLLVGYGTDSATNMKYWLIKNSWGTDFGEQGYLRLERGAQACGILTDVSSAQVA